MLNPAVTQYRVKHDATSNDKLELESIRESSTMRGAEKTVHCLELGYQPRAEPVKSFKFRIKSWNKESTEKTSVGRGLRVEHTVPTCLITAWFSLIEKIRNGTMSTSLSWAGCFIPKQITWRRPSKRPAKKAQKA